MNTKVIHLSCKKNRFQLGNYKNLAHKYGYVFLGFFFAAGNKTLFKIRRYPGEVG
jgi:hypothetical protein